MNSLSWLLYAANVCGSLKIVCVAVAIITLVLAGGGALIAWVEDEWDEFGAPFRWLMGAAVPALVLSCIIPSSTTLYAIAASEMGEKVINSQTGDKAVEALNAWLDKQITEASK